MSTETEDTKDVTRSSNALGEGAKKDHNASVSAELILLTKMKIPQRRLTRMRESG